ncbi:hypothetical protein K439DRAFT_1138413 [Ramaria rubella]|nr:hypothetical protein K439DRAFT_1138413 [Ramaria rubella]
MDHRNGSIQSQLSTGIDFKTIIAGATAEDLLEYHNAPYFSSPMQIKTLTGENQALKASYHQLLDRVTQLTDRPAVTHPVQTNVLPIIPVVHMDGDLLESDYPDVLFWKYNS